ncbi:MAG TPA: hypothetical protein VEK75_08410 [Xanthobacteraceae bacterium]|nr:hypothetical protein [Xanthobacteraceae bacterium]
MQRSILVALATLFTIGMTSMASACCNWGFGAPVAYATVAPVGYGGCGGCCGGCAAPTVAAVYAQPVAPAPIYVGTAVAPFGGPCCSWNGCGDCLTLGAAGGWGGCGNCGGWTWGRAGWGGCGGCCGSCGGCGGCGRVVYAAPSLYMINQGPVLSGPGIMAPYASYTPDTAYAPAADYPYVPGYGYGPTPVYPPYYGHLYYRPHLAYRAPVYVRSHPRVYRAVPQGRPFP